MANWELVRPICEYQWQQVKCSYVRYDKTSVLGAHEVWKASSLSRPGLEHIVYIEAKGPWYVLSASERKGMTVEGLLDRGLVRLWSSDEFWKYGGAAYYVTQHDMAILPEFRAPQLESHFNKLSHTALAVLEAWLDSERVRIEDESFSKDNFSRVKLWIGSEKRYR